MIRNGSIADDLMNLANLDSDLFQRTGILAAFDSWERAKRFNLYSKNVPIPLSLLSF